MRTYYVYILTNRLGGALYIGVTNDLLRRITEHRAGVVAGFTRTYGLKTLVYFEETSDVFSAIQREKQLKAWKRDWKIQLIERENPDWKDLSYNF